MRRSFAATFVGLAALVLSGCSDDEVTGGKEPYCLPIDGQTESFGGFVTFTLRDSAPVDTQYDNHGTRLKQKIRRTANGITPMLEPLFTELAQEMHIQEKDDIDKTVPIDDLCTFRTAGEKEPECLETLDTIRQDIDLSVDALLSMRKSTSLCPVR